MEMKAIREENERLKAKIEELQRTPKILPHQHQQPEAGNPPSRGRPHYGQRDHRVSGGGNLAP